MKKEIKKKTFSVNLQNVWIFAFFVNLYGILVVSGQKWEIRYNIYIGPSPPPPQYRAWVMTGDISLKAKSCFNRPYGTSLGELMFRNF